MVTAPAGPLFPVDFLATQQRAVVTVCFLFGLCAVVSPGVLCLLTYLVVLKRACRPVELSPSFLVSINFYVGITVCAFSCTPSFDPGRPTHQARSIREAQSLEQQTILLQEKPVELCLISSRGVEAYTENRSCAIKKQNRNNEISIVDNQLVHTSFGSNRPNKCTAPSAERSSSSSSSTSSSSRT